MIPRREFITLLGGAAAWPIVARAQQAAMPVVGVLATAPALVQERRMIAFHQGMAESGYVDGQTAAVEYFQAGGQYNRLPMLAADLVRRRVSVIVTPNSEAAAQAAKAATNVIPIVFSVTDDPVKLGLVASLSQPKGNATGVNNFSSELGAKRLGILRELLPGLKVVAALTNPNNPAHESALADIQDSAHAMGLQIQVLKASSGNEITASYETLARERPDALLIVNDPFFTSRRMQLVLLSARHMVPTIYTVRDYTEAGGLMSYAANMSEVYRQIGIYTGRVLRGAKPADLPVVQATKFEFVLNLQSANVIGLTVPPTLIARADEVIE